MSLAEAVDAVEVVFGAEFAAAGEVATSGGAGRHFGGDEQFAMEESAPIFDDGGGMVVVCNGDEPGLICNGLKPPLETEQQQLSITMPPEHLERGGTVLVSDDSGAINCSGGGLLNSSGMLNGGGCGMLNGGGIVNGGGSDEEDQDHHLMNLPDIQELTAGDTIFILCSDGKETELSGYQHDMR